MASARLSRLRRLPVAALLLLAPMLLGTAPPEHADTGSLAGQILIAAPDIGDPRFHHAVILMLRHDKNGAFGIIINRPVEQRTIQRLLEGTGEPAEGVEGSLVVFAGGPVQPQLGFVVHSTEYHRPDTLTVGEVAMTADKEILRDIGHHHGPKKTLFALGYAGWGAGQLEDEIDRHDWFTTTGDPKLIFDDDRDNLWDDAMARRTREL
jgi:putative transcriptional regulator